MDSGFSYGDIIIIGAIAAFILLRYRAMLGSTDGDEPTRNHPAPASEYDRVIQLPAARITALTEKKDELAAYAPSLAETFVAMRAIDKEFSPEEFLTGARNVYEMVLDAYNTGDRDTLKMLLSAPIYAAFTKALTEEEKSGNKTKTTLTAINSATIRAARLDDNTATITVDFLSEQIHLTYDKDGKVIEGDASLQEKTEDSWTFTRNLTSSDYNWKVIET